jgi:hypothetical protein
MAGSLSYDNLVATGGSTASPVSPEKRRRSLALPGGYSSIKCYGICGRILGGKLPRGNITNDVVPNVTLLIRNAFGLEHLRAVPLVPMRGDLW